MPLFGKAALETKIARQPLSKAGRAFIAPKFTGHLSVADKHIISPDSAKIEVKKFIVLILRGGSLESQWGYCLKTS